MYPIQMSVLSTDTRAVAMANMMVEGPRIVDTSNMNCKEGLVTNIVSNVKPMRVSEKGQYKYLVEHVDV